MIGFSGSYWTSDLINLGSYGCPRYSISHVAVIGHHPDHDNLVYQSCFDTHVPCAVLGKITQGTQAQPLESLLDYNGKVWLYRLRIPLRLYETDMLSCYLNGTLGRPYDRIGAWQAGGSILSRLWSYWIPEHTASLFCSEWVAAAYRHIERFDTDSVSRWSPNAFIRECQRRAIHLKPVRLK